MAKKEQSTEKKSFVFPPVITVVGHVDHGKTTLLDAIRKTSVATREHGGITQRIGASSVTIVHDGAKRAITFIDTPGHEAFSKMRGRGVQAADIALLIVSSIDGVKPQTKESIALLKDTKTPFIVVLTKSDSPDKQLEKAKQQLLSEDIQLEGYGGDVPVIEVSAKTNTNIQELLELILLVYDMNIVPAKDPSIYSSEARFQAIVIESKLDPKVGPKATVVVKNGSLALKDEVVSDEATGRVRNLIDPEGKFVQSATIGDAVEILGFSESPAVGSVVNKKGEQAVVVSEKSVEPEKTEALKPLSYDMFQKAGDKPALNLILCADTLGSLEAIIQAIPENVALIAKKTGDITEADVLLAKSTGAILLGFNTKIRPNVMQQAIEEKVLMKNYTVIYEMLDEIADVLAGKELALEEKIFGTAKILASFPFEKTKVCGIKVLEGRVAKGDKVRIERNGESIGEANIVSVRQGKEITSKVEQGNEAGIILSPLLDFTIGDMLICHG